MQPLNLNNACWRSPNSPFSIWKKEKQIIITCKMQKKNHSEHKGLPFNQYCYLRLLEVKMGKVLWWRSESIPPPWPSAKSAIMASGKSRMVGLDAKSSAVVKGTGAPPLTVVVRRAGGGGRFWGIAVRCSDTSEEIEQIKYLTWMDPNGSMWTIYNHFFQTTGHIRWKQQQKIPIISHLVIFQILSCSNLNILTNLRGVWGILSGVIDMNLACFPFFPHTSPVGPVFF